MNGFQKHKKSDAVKWAGVTFIILCIITAIVLGVFSSWYTNWDTSTWFGQKDNTEQTDKPTDKPEEDKVPVTDGDGNAMDPDKVYPMPERMAFSPLAYNAATATYSTSSVTVKATIEPANATEQGVTWSVAFKNPASAWATGKAVTDFVTVKVNTENNKESAVVCKYPFGEQIVFTAASVEKPDIKASCTIDYIKPLNDLKVAIDGGGFQNSGFTISPLNKDTANNSVFSFEPVYGLGTKTQDFETAVSFAADDGIPARILQDMVNDNIIEKLSSLNFTNKSQNFENLTLNFNNTFLNGVFGQIKNESEFVKQIVDDELYFVFTFSVTPQYGRINFFNRSCNINVSKFHVSVTGITVDKSDVVIDSCISSSGSGVN